MYQSVLHKKYLVNHVFNGIIVADKGFPVSSIQDSLKNKENLHYLSPLRRNSTLIIEHDMYSYDGILNDEMDNIQYKKCSLKNGRFLYSYRNPKRAIKEENDYLKTEKETMIMIMKTIKRKIKVLELLPL